MIVLMSGGIAVLADDLGRRLGKKRLHFRGIRPKRVAQIGTFTAGVVVSLVTIIIVSAASSGVRRWLAEGHRALQERDAAVRERNAAEASRDKTLRDLKAANELVAQAGRRSQELTSKNTALDRDVQAKAEKISRQQGELARLNTQIAHLTPRIAILQSRVKSADARVATLDGRLAERQKHLTAVENELEGVTAQLKSARNEGNEIKSDNLHLYAENGRLQKERDALQKDSEALKTEQAILIKARDSAQKELEDAKSDLAETQASLTNVEAQLAQSQSELRTTQQGVAAWKSIATVVRSAPMMYSMGQEVSRLAVPSGLSFQDADNVVGSLLRSARVAALKSGAKPNGNVPEAGLFGHDAPEQEVQRGIVSKIAGAQTPMVLVAYSMINAFKGEPVALEVVAYQNPLVYKRGDIVAETRIDGRKDPTTIFHQITDLGEQVRDKAKKDRMIPRLGSDELYGAVSSENVLKLVGDVKATERPVRVRAVAEENIRAGDPLRLSFIIR